MLSKKFWKLNILGWLGVVLLSVGLVAGSYYLYSINRGSAVDGQLQSQANQLDNSWQSTRKSVKNVKQAQKSEPTSFKMGETVGILRVPAWGSDNATPIVYGTTLDQLSKGVGMYTDSGLPGKVGNFAVAAHDMGDPQPFRHLLELNVGDKIIVDTKYARYVYVTTKSARETTLKAANGGWVIHAPEVDNYPDKATITMTTCTHHYRSNDRSVLFGQLDHVELKK